MAHEHLTVNKELVDSAAAQFGEGLHCSQIVFGYAAKKLGFDEVAAKKIADAFGGGMFNGERCGSLTGAMMALSLAFGHYNAETKPDEAKLHEKRIEIEKRFKEAFGSLYCQDIIGANIGTPEGMARFKAENLAKDCPVLVAYVIEQLDELLELD
ncbi:MAG: C-GCAxxG-C-C family protein [Lachnospiraceae bacterium]|nr:C-GCAxxG-C-C family protein [Lachnospiraceae bacterium]